MTKPSEVLAFWFGDQSQPSGELMKSNMRRWYQGGEEMDRQVREKFADDVAAAIDGKLDAWADEPKSRLALIILLDQFTRGIYRDSPQMYAGDAKAQQLSLDAFDRGLDRGLRTEERMFLMMPLLHAEDLVLQQRSVKEMNRLFEDAPDDRTVLAMGQEQSKKYLDIIERFGRFPHRNAIHGRVSTPAEQEFLKDWAEKQPPKGAAPANTKG